MKLQNKPVRCGLFLLLIILATDAPRIQAEESVPIQELKSHPLSSPHQRSGTMLQVLLPSDFDQARTYRTLYFLPVEAGTGTRWGTSTKEAIKHGLANRFNVICLFSTFSDLPWYANHPLDTKLQQETYFLKTVIPFVEEHYPVSTKSDDRYLIGFSKSGWGAWSLLLRHPDLFHKALAWDAPLMLDRSGPYGSGPIFGDQENFENYHLARLLKEKQTQFQNEPRLYHWGYDAFREQHEEMNALLRQLEIKSIYRDGPQRKHHWESGWLADAVELLLKED
ncbi:Putative esterase [Polystyrenella longa]|uniref:Esterase n=1 Tax=Polystyrenella longa TaxID=2528007 RepID=A0A518CKE4_9PLAN|nr:alpha/beta hydrolase-fold protein [Polystyrenella longa]QDU79692.1 Putative esterase [Polystyrenella longa]